MITFIIPSLNRESIKRSVDSLINQSDPNWKCIIVYDGVEGQTFDDDRIKTIQINKCGVIGKNHGQSGLVRNEGIKLCQTEWIGFLDDDDSLHPDYVKTLFEKYKDYDFVVWRMIYTNGKVLPEPNRDSMLFGKVGISFCYKNKFDNLYFENNRDGEDYDFLVKLRSLSEKWFIAPEIFYNVNH
jgi:glycosyltransferase involved in cell wall biosynthesis